MSAPLHAFGDSGLSRAASDVIRQGGDRHGGVDELDGVPWLLGRGDNVYPPRRFGVFISEMRV